MLLIGLWFDSIKFYYCSKLFSTRSWFSLLSSIPGLLRFSRKNETIIKIIIIIINHEHRLCLYRLPNDKNIQDGRNSPFVCLLHCIASGLHDVVDGCRSTSQLSSKKSWRTTVGIPRRKLHSVGER